MATTSQYGYSATSMMTRMKKITALHIWKQPGRANGANYPRLSVAALSLRLKKTDHHVPLGVDRPVSVSPPAMPPKKDRLLIPFTRGTKSGRSRAQSLSV
ncbi:hypothetical protein IMZ48_37605 [Candidatus Bathyarchaeota archaeon]|nr:hypothetical protein [Candidatus Bathyarchaeota archaeon]